MDIVAVSTSGAHEFREREKVEKEDKVREIQALNFVQHPAFEIQTLWTFWARFAANKQFYFGTKYFQYPTK